MDDEKKDEVAVEENGDTQEDKEEATEEKEDSPEEAAE